MAALAACSPGMGQQLRIFDSGQLSQLPRPQELLIAIGQPGAGDAVACGACSMPVNFATWTPATRSLPTRCRTHEPSRHWTQERPAMRAR